MFNLFLYLVRHAHSEWTDDKEDDTHRTLSVQGCRDAERVSQILQKYPIETIYSSPHLRARQTIQPFAAFLNVQPIIDTRLAERKLGYAPSKLFQNTIADLWSNPEKSLSGGESNDDAKTRGKLFLLHLVKTAQSNVSKSPHIALSTHGNLMALLMQIFYPTIDYVFWSRLSFPDIYVFPIGESMTLATDPTLLQEIDPVLFDGNIQRPIRLWTVT